MRTRLTTALLAAGMLTALVPALPLEPAGPVDVHGREIQVAVSQQRIVELPLDASHVALRWTGAPEAQLTIAFGRSRDGLGEAVAVAVDDDADGDNGEVSSGVIWTG